jgi:hypothetical protein
MTRKLSVTLGGGFVVVVLLGMCVFAPAAQANPDPCLIVYPDAPCKYHYDPAEYYTVGPGDPLYDPMYDRGGEVLIDINNDEIAYDIYQAPNITGFVMDSENQGYYTDSMDFDLIVDGWSNNPTTYVNILLVFDRVEPSWCQPDILIDGNPVMYDEDLGWYYPIGDLEVSTPTPNGNNYSDTITQHVSWSNCVAIRIYAFSDENYNLHRDCGECFSAFSHDTTVPTQDKSWGAIKEMYSE